MKSIRAKDANVQFLYFVQRDQHEAIEQHLTKRRGLFQLNAFVAVVVLASKTS